MNAVFRPLLSAALLLAAVSLGCGESQGTALRSAFLKGLAEDSILPTYRDFDTRAGTLATALETLEKSPTEGNLTATQSAWRAVREPWNVQEALHVGPSEDMHTGAAVNQVPSISGIESLLGGTTALTEASVAEQGANRKGMLTLEYLLFDHQGGNAAVLSRLTADGGAGERRRLYARLLGTVLKGNATAVHAAWEPAQGNFVAQLANAGNDGSRYTTQKQAVDEVVNRLIASVEKAELRLSKPLGFETGGTVRPDEEQTRRSDNSLPELLSAVSGMERVWNGAGTDGGLSRVVTAGNARVAETMRGDLAAVRAALEAIPPPLRTALLKNRESVEAARASLSSLRATLATEVAAQLGVTLSFNDNDGD